MTIIQKELFVILMFNLNNFVLFTIMTTQVKNLDCYLYRKTTLLNLLKVSIAASNFIYALRCLGIWGWGQNLRG